MLAFMDDIAIHTKRKEGETKEQHRLRHKKLVHEILDALEAFDLYLKPEKCEFEREEIEYCNVGGYPTCEFEGKRGGKGRGMALREPLERVLSTLSGAEFRENETDERGGKRDAKPVALVALPGETLGWPLALGAARGFLYYSKYLI